MNRFIRPIAIHLPQFHPIQENNEWWGKGFTEWTNVTKAKPLFQGHVQPHLPADLGFYDLRLEEARLAQEALAKAYGIYGFCYYHYWFNGKRVLDKPVLQKLANPKEDMPFMLCWANENWTRRWDGMDQEILLKQDYSEQDDLDHIRYLIDFFKDSRYIKVNGKPVFVLYKPFLMPDAAATAIRWRKLAAQYGLELYLCHTVFGYQNKYAGLIEGFDAAIDFEPFGIRRENIFDAINNRNEKNRSKLPFLKQTMPGRYIHRKIINPDSFKFNKIDYEWMISSLKTISSTGYKIYPAVVPGWDNTSRRQNGPTLILDKSSPELFAKWVRKVLEDFKPYSEQENFLFVNAWNEWAEGNHLEPCQRWGTAYLEALLKSINVGHDYKC